VLIGCWTLLILACSLECFPFNSLWCITFSFSCANTKKEPGTLLALRSKVHHQCINRYDYLCYSYWLFKSYLLHTEIDSFFLGSLSWKIPCPMRTSPPDLRIYHLLRNIPELRFFCLFGLHIRPHGGIHFNKEPLVRPSSLAFLEHECRQC